MKSYNYHILMQHLLPVLIQNTFKDRKEICSIIKSICTFSKALCSRVIDVEMLMTLEKGNANTLCGLEKICPPSVFVAMMHLPIQLAYEARLCGPIFYRWMNPYEW
ncbi:hypothetical protein GIB67_033515 [Kingdonia uniflora]|uniref:DUF4218 domain-containing protein n=1 Tax=Kingdonia uniflora TaxID=39325 RepID=A0A7J7L640_9MAGN|nr:hypothetical protein GIB67_033515 [Kingdonia uniflora]